ncbi:glutamyl-tRNA synthetase [uncultured bacterium]|nr:glutamyl-tRNA synthetase [uncultured bacterium]
MTKINILRYAPSLSGNLHIGNTKIILINYLFFKNNINNQLILRYDDSDYNNNLLTSLKDISLITHLLNINFTKIVFQSSHFKYIDQYIQYLMKKNLTYYCQCQDFNNCICITKNYNTGILFIKTKEILKDSQFLEINDLFYGKIKFPVSNMYNIAITRSDGTPLYNFITVISDIIDRINLVVRGNDHIANTWKQIIIYKALNIRLPDYAHVSLVLINKSKMSKSEGNGIYIIDLIKKGYIIDAIKEYLVILSGINIEENTKSDIINQNFKFHINNKSNQNFDIKKLENINYKIINNQNIYDSFILFCTINELKIPNLNNLEFTINQLKYRHKNLYNLYNEIILFDIKIKHKYEFLNTILTKSDITLISNIKNSDQIYELDDYKVRFIITGRRLGISIKEIKNIVNSELIFTRINYLLSLNIS